MKPVCMVNLIKHWSLKADLTGYKYSNNRLSDEIREVHCMGLEWNVFLREMFPV